MRFSTLISFIAFISSFSVLAAPSIVYARNNHILLKRVREDISNSAAAVNATINLLEPNNSKIQGLRLVHANFGLLATSDAMERIAQAIDESTPPTFEEYVHLTRQMNQHRVTFLLTVSSRSLASYTMAKPFYVADRVMTSSAPTSPKPTVPLRRQMVI
jgi:hypothetical protein